MWEICFDLKLECYGIIFSKQQWEVFNELQWVWMVFDSKYIIIKKNDQQLFA